MENKNQPAGAGTPALETTAVDDDDATITAAAVLVARRNSQRHHIVGLRRNLRGGHHPWLVDFANLEFSISDRKLRRPKRFFAVAERHAIPSRTLDVEQFLAFNYDRPCKLVWRDVIEHAVALIGGAS